MWEIVQSEEFGEWFLSLSVLSQDKILVAVKVLENIGPTLGRPWSDTIKGSKINNLKELRIQESKAVYRIFYVFDPNRRAVLLIGGDKRQNKKFYEDMIIKSEKIYSKYLKENNYEK